MPELKNPALPKRVAAVPATTAGLVAHYAASDGVLGTDLKKGAGSGDRVGLWGNLAPGAAADHLMAVEPQNRDRGPTLVTVQPSELPELAKPTPMLRFERSNRLIGYGKSAFAAKLKGAAMTTILVVRPDRERGPVLRLDSDEASPFLAWDITPNGYSVRLAKGSLAPTIEAKLGSARGRLMVLTHVWDGESVEQRIHVTLPDGYHAMVAAGDAPFKAQTIQRYSLGAISSDPEANTFEGLLAEWLIYDRALNDEEREGVESQLVKKYLKPSVALTIDSATPQRNGVIPPARNTSIAAPKGLPKAPAEEFLAAFYLGAHGTLGHDLMQPARLGQRVMAWGNLAPGASADHLLAYQGGQDGHTPLLIRAS
ncbi:MAG: hypothetical protein KDL87_17890, partial [Verrucomicrobiae bacterium]|nr:hypothetical protein [Verrucomicrobiae bacterium]